MSCMMGSRHLPPTLAPFRCASWADTMLIHLRGMAMRRREFIKVVGAAAAWPLAAHAQQSAMPVIGFLNSASPGPWEHYVAGFRFGLKEAGSAGGQDVR